MNKFLTIILALTLGACAKQDDIGYIDFVSFGESNCEIAYSININNEETVILFNDDKKLITISPGTYSVWITESKICNETRSSKISHTQITVVNDEITKHNIYSGASE